MQTLNSKIPGLDLQENDIDMCHRLGKPGITERPIIVKYVSRMKRNVLLRRRKELKGTQIYVNEDLTHLNRHVFKIIRKELEDPDRAPERVFVREGKLFHKGKEGKVRPIPFSEYKDWLGIQWPALMRENY